MSARTRSILTVTAAFALIPFALSGCSAPAAAPVTETSAPPVIPDNTGLPPVAASGFTIVLDDGDILGIEVPDTWTDTDTTPTDPFQQISASPDLAAFYAGIHSTYDTPGVTILSTQATTKSDDEYIQTYASQFGPDCQDGQTDAYDDGVFTGQYLYLPGCGNGADFVAVVAHDPKNSYLVLLTMVLVSDEDKSTNRDHLLGTFSALYP
ncbi:MAG: hypothetical protein ABJB03_05050 [Rhodoglobus sp.]